MVVANKSGDQPAAVFSKFEQVFPVNLCENHPHGQLALFAVLKTVD